MMSDLKADIRRLKEEKGAVILAHYYQRPEIQEVADYIGDSLALAQIAKRLEAPIIVLCGVHFMAETASALCPDKKVLCPDVEAGCSLADSCPAGEFEEFVKAHPGHIVVSYVNTSAAVKALTDVVVTSSNAVQIVNSLPKDAKIIFGPDRNLGNYINSVTGRQMVLWNGACHVHDKFSVKRIVELKKAHPEAKVLAHPECRKAVLVVADHVGSTASLLKYAQSSDSNEFIVATEAGILHEMQRTCPDKTFIPAPPDDAECGCNECEFMKMITLQKLYDCLRDEAPEVKVDEAIADRVVKPINVMLELTSMLSLGKKSK